MIGKDFYKKEGDFDHVSKGIKNERKCSCLIEFENFRYTTIIDRYDFPLRGSYEVKGNEIRIAFPNSVLVDKLFYDRNELRTVSFVTNSKEKTFRAGSDTVTRNGSQVILYRT